MNKFLLTVMEIPEEGGKAVQRLSMELDDVNLTKLIEAASRKPRKPRGDKGKARENPTLPMQ